MNRILTAGAAALLCIAASAATAQSYPTPEKLLVTKSDTVGAPIRYPAGTPQVASYLLTMVPGQTTGWHRHDVPLYARMLGGAITVDYGNGVTKTYRAGDTFMEAMDIWHDGKVISDVPAKILVVFIGSDAAKNTVMKPKK